jgi:hypothetical protein
MGLSKVRIRRLSDGGVVSVRTENEILVFDTQPGENYRIEPES